MKINIFIPTKINVGYQNRNDTYTGKLAYVIYFDEKGKLRKETSWQNWRDKDIDNDIFDNEPIEGFVLNKKVGGVEESYYDVRKTYVRVYDPRGFEFEITIPNLLWILENCTSTKGKGLEGQFIYGWDGKELVLVPIDSPDYQEISDKNKIIHNNQFVKAKDLTIGATYENLSGEKYVYMGKFDKYEQQTNRFYSRSRWSSFIQQEGWESPINEEWLEDKAYGYSYYRFKTVCKGKHFFFIRLGNPNAKYYSEKENAIWSFKTVTRKFSGCINNKCHDDYIEFMNMLEHDSSYSGINYSASKILDLPYENFYKLIQNLMNTAGYGTNVGIIDDEGYLNDTKVYYNSKDKILYYKKEEVNGVDWYGGKKYKETEVCFDTNSIEELYKSLHPVYGERYLENGNLFEREKYYGTEK